MARRDRMRLAACSLFCCAAILRTLASPATAASVPFTVTANEPVTVTGTPRIAIDVGGVPKYATYQSGSGTSTLTFAYAVQPGDFDANGIAVTPSIDSTTGAITDLAGNTVTSYDFALSGSTTNLKVQTYTVDFITSPITESTASAISFIIAKAPVGGTFTYTITSSGGAGSVEGFGTISSLSQTVSGVNVANLPPGTLTLSVTVSKSGAGTGSEVTMTATPSLAGVLNGVSASVDAAYSTRRLTSAYTGPLLTVRRSTDNTTMDIPATLGGGLDASVLSSFCGSASCFVQTWYDQSGNGRHATQTAAARQPRIVNAGTIELLSGLPSLYFNGVNSVLTTAIDLPAATAVWSNYLVDVLGNGGGGRGRVWATSTGTGNPGVNAILVGDDYFSTTGNFNSLFSTTPRIVSWQVISGGTSRVWDNGTETASTTVSSWSGGVSLLIGDVPVGLRPLNAKLHTVILGSGTASTADRQAIESWLGKHSGIQP